MSDIKTIINNIKQLSLDNLSDSELNTLKDEIIKLLVDIQIQKDINAKISKEHISTDDVQIEIMQKTNSDIHNESNQNQEIHSEVFSEKTEQPTFHIQSEYHKVIEEKISDEIISIYSDKSETAANNAVQGKVSERDTNEKESSKHKSIKKINFSINDKFRMIKKLFNNNTNQFNEFINLLNDFQNLSDSEHFIKETSLKYQWDEDSLEYKILLQQNHKRFR
ncbi:MAG: hypothetical protein N2203_07275 [Bacteroidia bacterium]|nr:hypothetical protein [Bacteroidia bacterium]